MYKKKSKQISVLMLLFIFILGMYLDLSKADSSFLYISGGEVDSRILSVAPVFTDAHAFAAMMPGANGDKGYKHLTSRMSRYRGDTGKTPDFLSQNILGLSEIRCYSGFQLMQALFGNHDELVTKYIHNSDGKKRIS